MIANLFYKAGMRARANEHGPGFRYVSKATEVNYLQRKYYYSFLFNWDMQIIR